MNSLVKVLCIVVSVFLSNSIVHAQVEAPPNEPPYTSSDTEFEPESAASAQTSNPETLSIENEIAAEAESVPTVNTDVAEEPPPPPQESDPAPRVVDKSGENRKFIRHPGAKKGLRFIDRDGSYYYQATQFSKKDQTSIVRIGGLTPTPAITSADGMTNYATMYGDSSPVTLFYDYEWQAFQGFGSLGVQAGFGFFTATGAGRFQCDDQGVCPTLTPKEKYTFYAFPLNLGLVYRFEYFSRQWIAPYVAGGGTYFGLLEMRDDGKSPTIVGTPAAYGAGGLMFNLSAMDRDTGFSLDAEYGIAALWLTLEARQIQTTNEDLDVSGSIISFGVSADY